jgi:hypothetical protein
MVGMLVLGFSAGIKALRRKGLGTHKSSRSLESALSVAGVDPECLKEPVLPRQQVHGASAASVGQGSDHPGCEDVVGYLQLKGLLEQGQNRLAQRAVYDLEAREQRVFVDEHPDSLSEERLRVVEEPLEVRLELILF